MRMPLLCTAALALVLAACQEVTAPPVVEEEGASYGVTAMGTGNKCYGEIVKGIASTWPFAHDGRQDFLPPPGAVALWINIFGPGLGISNVHELQLLFCTPG